jgi:hypothetical protein
MRSFPILLILFAAPSVSADQKRLVVPILEATSPADHPTRSIFGRDGWRPEQLGRVIVRLVAEKPFEFGGMDLDNCGTAELEYWFFAGGKHLTPSVAQQPVRTDDLVIVLTGVDDLCLSNARILDGGRSPYQLVFSDRVAGQVRASSTLAPEHGFHPMRLFDDDLAHAWSTNGRALNERLDFELEEETTIDGLLIWSGYHRSEKQFRANARPKVLTLSSEGQADMRLELEDTLAGQTITLPKPWTGKRFSLTTTEVTRGTKANNLMLSELRFVSSERILTLDSRAFDAEVAQALRASFQTAKLHGALDHPLRSKSLTLFLWSDGGMVAATRSHLVHGSITVKKADANKLVLQIVGTVRDQRVPGRNEAFTGQVTLGKRSRSTMLPSWSVTMAVVSQ